MTAPMPIFFRVSRKLISLALGFYFSRIERFHRERVPAAGPVLFTSNHPNSVTDAFVIGTSVPRKVNFVATVQLFQAKPVRWLLSRCGVIPINRVKDDPRAMRTVLETFEACFAVLERGEAIGIFPEGITHDDPQLKAVKTGPARMALELEHRHQGRLGLQILPVGLTFSAKERYRSEALVHFGEPIRVADFLAGYPQQKHGCIRSLSAALEQRIQALILHLPRLERARLVEAVKRLYLDRLVLGQRVHEPAGPRAEELLLTQAIASAVDWTFENEPGRAAIFVRRLDDYERWLKRLRLSDEWMAHLPGTGSMIARSLGWAILAVGGAPVAAYGWLHRLAPIGVINWAGRRFGQTSTRRTSVSTAAIVGGILSFTIFYGVFVGIFHALFGWPATLFYALSLPVAGLVAHYYLRELQALAAGLRATLVLLRAPLAARHLLARRAELIAEIEAAREARALSLARAEQGGRA